MKNKKGSGAPYMGLVIVLVLLLAFVGVYFVSLVDTTPPSGTSNQFRSPPFAPHDSYIAERMVFFESVEIYSISADLIWGERVGTCIIYAELKDRNSIYFPPVVVFQQTSYGVVPPPDEAVTFTGITQSGLYEFIPPGEYWLMLHAGCSEAGQAMNWRWYHPGLSAEYDPAVVEPMGPCVDLDLDDYWQDDECWYYDSSYLLDGRVYDPGGDIVPPVDNETGEPSPPPPPLIDAKTGMAYEYNWVMWAILGGVIVIVLVVIVVAAVKF